MQLLHSLYFCCFLILSTANTDLGIGVVPPAHPWSLRSFSFFHCAGQVTFRVLDQLPYRRATLPVENCVSTQIFSYLFRFLLIFLSSSLLLFLFLRGWGGILVVKASREKENKKEEGNTRGGRKKKGNNKEGSELGWCMFPIPIGDVCPVGTSLMG